MFIIIDSLFIIIILFFAVDQIIINFAKDLNLATLNLMPSSSVKTRLAEFLKSQKISKAEFCRQLGLSPTYVNAMRKSLPADRVRQIIMQYPNLNRDWLLYGDGEMLIDAPSDLAPTYSYDKKSNSFMVPLLPVEAYAGNLQEYSRGVSLRECTWIAAPVKGADFAITVSGNSMEPEIHSGSIAAICKINDEAFIPWGNPMVIDTENGVLIKTLYPSEKDNGHITARSFNPAFPPFDIPIKSIYGFYRIVACWRKMITM